MWHTAMLRSVTATSLGVPTSPSADGAPGGCFGEPLRTGERGVQEPGDLVREGHDHAGLPQLRVRLEELLDGSARGQAGDPLHEVPAYRRGGGLHLRIRALRGPFAGGRGNARG